MTSETYKKKLLGMKLSEMTSRQQTAAITFALDDMVKEGKLRKEWDDKSGQYTYIDSRVPKKKVKKK